MTTPAFILPPSYVGVALTATTATIATITPLLSADGGGLLAHRVDPAASIPRGVADRRRLAVERALDLGGRIAAQIASRPVPPASVMILDPHEAVARNGMSPIQLLDTAGVTAVGIALAAALAGHGIDVAVTDRRTVEGALHGDARAARDSLTAHRVVMYGALAAGGGGQAGVALDLATLGAYTAGALDAARWSLLSTAPMPAFEGVEAEAEAEAAPEPAPAPVDPAPEPAPVDPDPAPPVEEAGDSTPAAQTTEPEPEQPTSEPEPEEPAAPEASPLRQVAAAIIDRDDLDQEQVTEWAGLLGPAPLLAAAEQRGEKAVTASAAQALGVEAGNGVLAAVMIAAADAGGEIEEKVRTALRPAPAA
ncbi:MAG: hypothetical protein KC933_32845 [Myxococcales bacterium]|nr:hypothetical protein [Myxococcales bacterium]